MGLSVSDERKIIATSLGMIEVGKDVPSTLLKIQSKVSHPLEKVVIGYPLLMNGKESEMCHMIKAFANELTGALNIPVVLWDERLTSAQAERALKEMNVSRKNRTGKLDAIAAMFILQSYLDSNASRNP